MGRIAPQGAQRPAAPARGGFGGDRRRRFRRRVRHLLRAFGRRGLHLVRTARLGAAAQNGARDGRRRAEGGPLRRTDARGERLCQHGDAGQFRHPSRNHRRDHRPAEFHRRQRREAGRKTPDTDSRGRDLQDARRPFGPAADLLFGQTVPPGRHRPRRAGLRRAAADDDARRRPPRRGHRRLDRGGRRRGEDRCGDRIPAGFAHAADAAGHGADGALSREPHRPGGQFHVHSQPRRVGCDRHSDHHARHGLPRRGADRQFAALLDRRHAAPDAISGRGAEPHLAGRFHHRDGHARRQRHRRHRQCTTGHAAGRGTP